MIVCPNCNHQNPDGAVQCEACYTPLPAMMSCPNCGTTVQADASFCGQCGSNLRTAASEPVAIASPPPTPNAASAAASLAASSAMPDLLPLDPLVPPDPLVAPPLPASQPVVSAPLPAVMSTETPMPTQIPVASEPVISSEAARSSSPVQVPPVQVPPVQVSPPEVSSAGYGSTQLQQQTARLLHLQTSASLELPQSLAVVHIGKPNERIPPDIDVSGFPDSEIVSRIHADIRVEGDAYYVEDVGSSNGTYINNVPLPMGNRHRLRPGDRISLGKGDKMTFLFQLS